MPFGPEDAALAVARWGAYNALALACVGLVVIALGEKAFRPVAAVLAGSVALVAVSLAMSKWWAHPPLPSTVIAASAAVGLAVVGLAAPMFGTIAAIVGAGWLVGNFVAMRSPENERWALLVGIVGASFVASAFASLMPRFVTAIAGGLCTALGVWAYVGASGLSPELFRVTAVWMVLAGVLVLTAAAVERTRHRVMLAAGDRRQASALKKAKEAKEKEDRERYERYMK